jgi:hypothetical protein
LQTAFCSLKAGIITKTAGLMDLLMLKFFHLCAIKKHGE